MWHWKCFIIDTRCLSFMSAPAGVFRLTLKYEEFTLIFKSGPQLTTVVWLADTARRWMVCIFQRLSCTRATTMLPLARKHNTHSSRHMNNPLLGTGICQNDRYGPLAFGSGCLFISLELRASKSETAMKRKKKYPRHFQGDGEKSAVDTKWKQKNKPGMCVCFPQSAILTPC